MKVTCLLVLLFVAFVAATKVRCPAKDSRRSSVLLADPKSCSRFYICSNGVPVRQNCPRGLNFNAKLRVCDYPERAGCKRRPRSFAEELFGDEE